MKNLNFTVGASKHAEFNAGWKLNLNKHSGEVTVSDEHGNQVLLNGDNKVILGVQSEDTFLQIGRLIAATHGVSYIMARPTSSGIAISFIP
jgi:hypothetical protein